MSPYPLLGHPLQGCVAQLPAIIDELANTGYVVTPDFIPAEACRVLADECRKFRHRGEFHRAGVGRGEMQGVRRDIRSDAIRWIEPGDCGPNQAGYLQLMQSYQELLKRELFLPLVEFESFCAVYPPGSFYKRHLDQFRGVEQRTVTAILYLNESWSEEDGGQLRIYLDADDKQYLEVLPQMGTLVTFLSADYWHEVLAANRDRFSITGWFKTPPIGNAFPLQ